MEKNVMSNLKRWTDAIAAEEIARIIPELKEILSSGDVPEETTNKLSFKILQHLSHAAYKYDRTKIKLGSELTRMTQLVCSKMTSVPNTKKFFSSIYYIVVCLLDMCLYNEAMKISDYILPKYNLCREDETITRLDILQPTLALWQKRAMNLSKNMDFSKRKDYDLFIRIVEYDLYLTKLTLEQPSCGILTRLFLYTKRIVLKCDTRLTEEFKDFVVNCVRKSDITLNNDESNDTWQNICNLISLLIGKQISSANIGTIVKNYSRYFDAFRHSVISNKTYCNIFIFLESLCDILLRSVENFTKDYNEAVDQWINDFNERLKMENREVVRSYCYAILQLLVSIIGYWEENSKKKETCEYVTSDMIVGILKLSKEHASMYGTFDIVQCNCEIANCRIRTDIGNELILTIKCLSLIFRRPSSLTCETVRKYAIDMIATSVKLFEIEKITNCGQWKIVWPSWGAAVYNMGVTCENTFPKDSMQLYTHLYKSIVILEGVKIEKRLLSFDDPLGTILHRLSSVCLKNQWHARGKSIAAINCLLSHDIIDTKAYRDWTNIKYKDSTDLEITIVQYLRNNELEIPQVKLEDYDLVRVCTREIKALQESQLNLSTSIIAVLDEMERLKAKKLDYIQSVQLLGYHTLNFSTNSSLRKYLRKATLMYESEKSRSLNHRGAYAMIKFIEFVERTRDISRKTEAEMKSAKFALTASVNSSETGSTTDCDVVPAYSAINMTITRDLKDCLNQAFREWRKFIDSKCRKSIENWEIRYTLHSIKIAGEYASLYRFEELENEAWSMIYKFANEIGDSSSIVYATSRSLTSTNFQPDWIEETDKHVEKLANCKDRDTMDIITRYRLCLANFYYENDEIDKADVLFDRGTSTMKFMHDMSNFLIAKDIEMKHRLGRNEDDDQTSYTTIIIHCLYTLISMDDAADTTYYGHKETQLYDYQILLDFTNNLALRMNSLLSFREISAHLSRRLSTAQKLVTAIRVAECLKFLSYIDLSRANLEDCEVKLQGLEHILEIEAFDLTMKSNLSPCNDYKESLQNPTTQHIDAIRDCGQSDASPILRKKVFAKPDFMLHDDSCTCFKCTNTHYQYLVFACTHIRAQLFALRKNDTAAFQHFHGALTIKKCILAKQAKSEMDPMRNIKFSTSCPQRQREAIEYVMFHLDYCRFVDWSMPKMSKNDVKKIAQDALELCEKYNLRNHPIYMSVNEIIFQCRFEKLFTKEDLTKFMVPPINEINVDCYKQLTAQDPVICVTPMREYTAEKRPISVRRRKTPPFLNLDRDLPIDLDDRETATTTVTLSKFTITKTRRLRRKICDDEDYSEDQEEQQKLTIKTEKTYKTPKIEITSPSTMENTNLNDLSVEASSVNKSNVKLVDIDETNLQLGKLEITDKIDDEQSMTKKITRLRKKKIQPVVTEDDVEKSTKKIDEVTELLNDMKMSKQRDCLEIGGKSENITENTDSRLSKKISRSSRIVHTSDVASSSENEEFSTSRTRESARLRKKNENPVKSSEILKNAGASIVSESKSDDNNCVAGTSSGRRSAKEQNKGLTEKIVKKSVGGKTTRNKKG